MKPKISAAGLIDLGNKVANLLSFISIIFYCIIRSLIITFQEFYSCFRRLVELISYLFFDFCKITTNEKPCPVRENRENNANDHLTREDVEIVMEKLGLIEEPLSDSFEVQNIFDRITPCLDEVRQAFRVFDENNDGFIEAEELRKVVSLFGLTAYSEEECHRMIMAFDDNGDKRIDFDEFVKMMEECSW
ncbi:Calmodulin and related proteins (EF-Hand superfamily) [Handroanthus impetiginosus]|uniref:Calmodulin and related proteins (EF-Hand superfamily) n=1 Tax=Handroanthus impetiginosus TaxID=429701 RepID=A0A2G9HSZ8_9LAMI|nr:Calmodulin and related proteins (EF-Hand superfamily) [Handroanthus impetiginosus]